MNNDLSSAGRKSIKVIYIMGAARSGSTLLDAVLGSGRDIVATGELVNLPRAGWVNGEYCSCGLGGKKCPFWSEIRERWEHANIGVSPSEYMALQAKVERIRFLPRLIMMQRKPSHTFRRYAACTRSLYEAIQSVAGKGVIVDSSKNPARALALSMVPGIDLRLVHLVRDGRGVVWSHLKAFEMDGQAGLQRRLHPVASWKSSLYWLINNMVADIVLKVTRKNGLRGCNIRYEDFVSDPEAALKSIGATTGMDFTQLAGEIRDGRELREYHAIAGNRMRMARNMRIEPDLEWHQCLPIFDKVVFWALAGILARKYGYRRFTR